MQIGDVLWTPTPEQIAETNLSAFTRWLGRSEFEDYSELWAWSTTELAAFWRAIWDHYDVVGDGDLTTVLGSRKMPGARWFPGAKLNYAENLFRGHRSDDVAIVVVDEADAPTLWDWGTLRDQTARVAAGLSELGIGSGDVVAGYLPNVPEAVATFLACAAIGAVWTCAPPEFGARAVVDRFAQTRPRVLVATDGYRFNGREYDRRDVVADLRAGIDSLEHVVILPRRSGGMVRGDFSWTQFTQSRSELNFERMPFDHPLWILYSSGTTGLPKAIVHGHGGILLEQLKAHHLHLDTHAGDRVFQYTTTGWMMWNYLVGVLLTRASIVLYDGSPTYGSKDHLWKLADQTATTHFGVSAGFLSMCVKTAVDPHADGRDLSVLKSVSSTGSPLSLEGYRWVYEAVSENVRLTSSSGGTDVCTAFVGGVPVLPVYAGEMQGRALGAAVHSFDSEGRDVIGGVGELVVTEPMPSMPVGLWGDADGSRLHAAYFDVYPGVWRHGDWLELTERGTARILGRSDATINRGGVRMGTSEIYRAITDEDMILDALVVDVPIDAAHSWMPMFLVLRDGAALSTELIERLKTLIRHNCSPRHVPDEFIEVSDLPRTATGKTLEIPVKRLLMGQPVDQALAAGTLADPAALGPFLAYARTLAARSGGPSSATASAVGAG